MITNEGFLAAYRREIEDCSRALAEEKEKAIKDLMNQGVDINKLALVEQQAKYELIGGKNPCITQMFKIVMKEDE